MRRPAVRIFLAAAAAVSLAACSRPQPGGGPAETGQVAQMWQAGETGPDRIQSGITEAAGSGFEKRYFTVRTAEEGSPLDLAGKAVAEAINNTVTGARAKAEPSKGSTVNVLNIQEGDADLGLVYGDLAGDAYSGSGAYEGNRKEKIRAIGACLSAGSLWMVREDSELRRVDELRGMILAAGDRASKTETASKMAFTALGIDRQNTELWNLSQAEGRSCLEEATVDAAHEFRIIQPAEGLRALSYEEEEILEIIEDTPSWYRIDIPAGTFPGQTETVTTFGVKILLCASADMDEELAYEIAKAMDLKAGSMAEQYAPMEVMEEKHFLCGELPVPLHPGAERYYTEMGYDINHQ